MIEVIGLTKRYPKAKVNALEHVDLKIETGEFFGLLGPNGAGKTTLISLIATLLYPTEGEIRIDGEVLTRKRNDIKRKLSLITQHNSLRNDMTLDEIMELQGRFYYMENTHYCSDTDSSEGSILTAPAWYLSQGSSVFSRVFSMVISMRLSDGAQKSSRVSNQPFSQ